MENRIPVICDRCRAEGVSGVAAFANLGDLLDFEPVPRRKRVDGWTAEVQRAFIAALAVTGSDRQAAIAVGKAQYGVDQLKKAEGNEDFMIAHKRAMAMAQDAKSRRLAAGLHAITAPVANWRPPEPAWSKASTRQIEVVEEPADPNEPFDPDKLTPEENVKLDLIRALLHKYKLKLDGERRARVQGRIAEADYYLRQITIFEVSLDVVTGDGMKLLKEARLGKYDLMTIAETTMSKLLDEVRRQHWEECGDPPRPEYPPRHLLKHHDGFSTEPIPTTQGGLAESHEQQLRKIEKQRRQDANDHIEWEEAARRDYEERRDSDASS